MSGQGSKSKQVLSGDVHVVNIEEGSGVDRTPAPKTVHILYTTITYMLSYHTNLTCQEQVELYVAY